MEGAGYFLPLGPGRAVIRSLTHSLSPIIGQKTDNLTGNDV